MFSLLETFWEIKIQDNAHLIPSLFWWKIIVLLAAVFKGVLAHNTKMEVLYIYKLPRGTVQFLLNSALDTLPTNSNLCKWGKRSNANCDLCRGKKTLLHALNKCPRMFEQGRYTWRHNSVLNIIANILEKYVMNTTWDIYVDLPGKICKSNSMIPTDIIQTTPRHCQPTS